MRWALVTRMKKGMLVYDYVLSLKDFIEMLRIIGIYVDAQTISDMILSVSWNTERSLYNQLRRARLASGGGKGRRAYVIPFEKYKNFVAHLKSTFGPDAPILEFFDIGPFKKEEENGKMKVTTLSALVLKFRGRRCKVTTPDGEFVIFPEECKNGVLTGRGRSLGSPNDGFIAIDVEQIRTFWAEEDKAA